MRQRLRDTYSRYVSVCQVRGTGPGRVTLISRIYADGGKAYELYYRYCCEAAGLDIIKLPSASPANAAYGMDSLPEAWSVIL